MFKHRSRRALLVVWLGIAALALNLLAGISHVGFGAMASATPEPGVLELCTAQGVIRVDAQTLTPLDASAVPHSGSTRCCDLCGATGGMAVVVTAIPSFDLVLAAGHTAAPPRDLARGLAAETLTPLLARGPPVLS